MDGSDSGSESDDAGPVHAAHSGHASRHASGHASDSSTDSASGSSAETIIMAAEFYSVLNPSRVRSFQAHLWCPLIEPPHVHEGIGSGEVARAQVPPRIALANAMRPHPVQEKVSNPAVLQPSNKGHLFDSPILFRDAEMALLERTEPLMGAQGNAAPVRGKSVEHVEAVLQLLKYDGALSNCTKLARPVAIDTVRSANTACTA
jgi:hypothetical protein